MTSAKPLPEEAVTGLYEALEALTEWCLHEEKGALHLREQAHGALVKYRAMRAATQPAALPEAQPVPMILTCPSCGERHYDEGEFATKAHHTHACQGCGMVWRPAKVATVGVRFLPGYKSETAAAMPEENPDEQQDANEKDAAPHEGGSEARPEGSSQAQAQDGSDWLDLGKENEVLSAEARVRAHPNHCVCEGSGFVRNYRGNVKIACPFPHAILAPTLPEEEVMRRADSRSQPHDQD